MAELSKALPLTARYLSLLTRFKSGVSEKVASDLGTGGGFRRVLNGRINDDDQNFKIQPTF